MAYGQSLLSGMSTVAFGCTRRSRRHNKPPHSGRLINSRGLSMNKRASLLTIVATIGLVATMNSPAHAQNERTFVSALGNDGNNCRRPTPCRTFAAAYAVTNAGGEIDVLDPAGYGPLTITSAISIINDGVGTAALIPPPGGTGITINAGVNDAVHLRGLTIDGQGTGQTGIRFNTGASLTVENCIIRHVSFNAIEIFPNASSSLSVSNSLVSDNGNIGIDVAPTGSGTVSAVFNQVQIRNNGSYGILVYGVNSTGTVKATVYDSVSAGNDFGFYAATDSGKAPTTLMLFHSVAANNGNGLLASGVGGIIRIANSMVTGNVNGWIGTVQSYGNNSIDGNTSNETAPPGVALK
jgi:hypothetical protein